MQPYTEFASVYDTFMDNVPYDEWADYVEVLLKKYNIGEGLILELGCGTGSMTGKLADKGYDMIGIDASEEMLSIAREKCEEKASSHGKNPEMSTEGAHSKLLPGICDAAVRHHVEKSVNSNDSILYLCQDMREFELYGTVAAVISVCDSMNYILSEEDLLQVFRLVNNYLDPSGLFIFDLDTQYAYEEILGDTTIAENREEGSFIWENTYYEDEMVNEINLTLFIPERKQEKASSFIQSEGEAGEVGENQVLDEAGSINLFRKYEETHYRKTYSVDTIRCLIEEAGMEWVAVYDALTQKKPKKDSERIYIIAREKHQADKLYL